MVCDVQTGEAAASREALYFSQPPQATGNLTDVLVGIPVLAFCRPAAAETVVSAEADTELYAIGAAPSAGQAVVQTTVTYVCISGGMKSLKLLCPYSQVPGAQVRYDLLDDYDKITGSCDKAFVVNL